MNIIYEGDSQRLDKYLIDELGKTRTKIQKMIENEEITINEKKAKSSYNLKTGDKITIKENEEEIIEIKPEKIPLDIVYEDEDLLVVNKPSGMVVHPGAGNNSGTMVNALMYHCNQLSQINGTIRPGIVHRIDADTSGLLVVAKNDETHNSLAEQIKNKTVTRKYLALADGIISEDTATIDAPIGRDKRARKKMCVTSENSKPAITHIKVLERYLDSTLIECILETGRTHQIRVHLNYINHPIVNDPVYGKNKQIDKTFGQMLHAETLGFIHPKTKKYLEFTVTPPQKFTEILNIYKNKVD